MFGRADATAAAAKFARRDLARAGAHRARPAAQATPAAGAPGSRDVTRGAMADLLEGLDRLASAAGRDRRAPLRLGDRLWAFAGLEHALASTLAAAYARSGSQVRETIFYLHRLIGHAARAGADDADAAAAATAPVGAPTPGLQAAPPSKKAAARAPAPVPPVRLDRVYEAYARELVTSDPDWHTALINLIDVLAERLTLHRYSRAGHRRRHARALLAAPLALILRAGGADAPAPAALDGFAELLLAAWDARQAKAHAERGWNRLEVATDQGWSGFYGLADQSTPPDAEAIAAATARIGGQCRAAARDARLATQAHVPTKSEVPSPNAPPAWLAPVLDHAADLTLGFAAEGRWPGQSPERPRAAPSIWRRLWRYRWRSSD